MLLLDTNVVPEVRKSTCNPNVEAWMSAQSTNAVYISAITVLEIQRGIRQVAQRGDERQAAVLNRWLEEIVLPAFSGRILPVATWWPEAGPLDMGRRPRLPRPTDRGD